MSFDAESLRRHYASLTMEALSELNPADLVPEASAILAAELAQRSAAPILTFASDAPPPWFETAALACSYPNEPGVAESPEALEAVKYLNSAVVPTYLSVAPAPSDDEGENIFQDFLIYVPGHLSLKAASVLAVNIFNPRLEETWRTQLESIADDQLSSSAPQIVCAGMQDRIDRFTRSYDDELARRGLPARSAGG